MESHLVELFRHNRWANLKLLDWCAGVDPALLEIPAPGTFGRADQTLVHLTGAEERYIEYLTGEMMPDDQRLDFRAPFPGFEVLRPRLEASGDRLIKLAASTPFERVLRGKRLDGTPYALRATTVLIQAITHSCEHRAHVMTAISSHGVEAPELDGWLYGEEHFEVDAAGA
ncbi:MAG TPA: DinB family protein [Thermomicrobiales bacterium]|nr:DinB family protein [Thermomicrobiales bacterium]